MESREQRRLQRIAIALFHNVVWLSIAVAACMLLALMEDRMLVG